jgi:hypothetical protein
MILFLKLCYLPQGILDPPIGVLNFVRLLLLRSPQGVEFTLVAFRNEGCALRQLGLKASPGVLMVVAVFLEEQPEGLLDRKLGNSCEIPDTETIQHLGALQLAFAQAQRALDTFGRH